MLGGTLPLHCPCTGQHSPALSSVTQGRGWSGGGFLTPLLLRRASPTSPHPTWEHPMVMIVRGRGCRHSSTSAAWSLLGVAARPRSLREWGRLPLPAACEGLAPPGQARDEPAGMELCSPGPLSGIPNTDAAGPSPLWQETWLHRSAYARAPLRSPPGEGQEKQAEEAITLHVSNNQTTALVTTRNHPGRELSEAPSSAGPVAVICSAVESHREMFPRRCRRSGLTKGFSSVGSTTPRCSPPPARLPPLSPRSRKGGTPRFLPSKFSPQKD